MQTAKIPRSTCDSLDRKTRQFLWGGDENKKKVHLLSWETVQKPMTNGGLGIRSSRQSNAAFLTKLGWRILSEPTRLWARVLRAKYCNGRSDVDMFQPRSNMSSVWSGISAQAKIINTGSTVAVGNGRKTLFWDHSWVEKGCLSEKAILTVPDSLLGATVGDMWDESSGWKWDTFSNYLPSEELLKIAAYSLSSDPNMEDTLYWNASSNGKFSIKSALAIIKDQDIPPESNPGEWHLIWKLSVQQRIRMFIWLTAHERLMCNYNRVRRGLSDDPICPRCLEEDETTDHLLRHCPYSRELWQQLGDLASLQSFYTIPFTEWVSKNASNDSSLASTNWSMKFAITCWWIWRWRNNLVFGQADTNPTNPYHFLQQQFKSSKKAFDPFSLFIPYPGSLRHEILIRWHPPPFGWHLLCTDGASKGNPGLAGCGGVIRDDTGNFVSAFFFSVEICSSIRAEMRALVAGLEHARSLGIRKLLIHVDNSSCVALVNEEHLMSSSIRPLVTRCRELINVHGWSVKVEHVYREAN